MIHKGKLIKKVLKKIKDEPMKVMEPTTKITIMGEGDPKEMLEKLPEIAKMAAPAMERMKELPEVKLDDLKKVKKRKS